MLHDLKEFLLIAVQFFQRAGKQQYAAMGVGLVVAFLYFRIFFGDASGFAEDVDKAGKIPIVDQDYDYVEKRWSKEKIMVWILLSLGSAVLAFYQLPDWFPTWFAK
jgi:hypothetical protein